MKKTVLGFVLATSLFGCEVITSSSENEITNLLQSASVAFGDAEAQITDENFEWNTTLGDTSPIQISGKGIVLNQIDLVENVPNNFFIENSFTKDENQSDAGMMKRYSGYTKGDIKCFLREVVSTTEANKITDITLTCGV